MEHRIEALMKLNYWLCGGLGFLWVLGIILLLFATNSFADDIVATTSNGSTVLLHDNGRWEYYQNNAKIRDVRPSAIPEDAKFQITIQYESVDKIKKDVRMMLEGELATEEEIRDSLRKVPSFKPRSSAVSVPLRAVMGEESAKRALRVCVSTLSITFFAFGIRPSNASLTSTFSFSKPSIKPRPSMTPTSSRIRADGE